jgi:hypothetical protein
MQYTLRSHTGASAEFWILARAVEEAVTKFHEEKAPLKGKGVNFRRVRVRVLVG